MVNATANVIFKQPLFKTDFGGHTKAYSRNVEIYGGGCGCVAGDPTNQFVANQCVAGWRLTVGSLQWNYSSHLSITRNLVFFGIK